ncbi:MAG: hypothetical protein KIT09_36040 [Bryobacteraceae bacterium]|nr:hypothetical protein [Bryobacteraceae bacterium]
MAQPCSCTVSFVDPNQIRHSVDVMAESLFEAAILALRVFRTAKLLDCTPGTAAVFEVKVSSPAVTHTVSLRRVQEWLESSGKTPREQALKHRLCGILDGATGPPLGSH